MVSLKPGGALRASLEAAGTPVLDLGIGRKLSALSGLARLTKIIKTTQPDVVQSRLYHADLLATLALALSGVRPLAWSGGSGARTWTCAATRAATATS